MSKKPRVDQDLLHRRAQVAVLAGLLRSGETFVPADERANPTRGPVRPSDQADPCCARAWVGQHRPRS